MGEKRRGKKGKIARGLLKVGERNKTKNLT